MKYSVYVEKYVPSLEGKLYLVTGANSGLGYSACKTFLSKGAAVIMACRNLEKADKAKAKLLEMFPSGKIDIVHFDQADKASIDSLPSKLEKYEHIDALILNAGIFHPGKNLYTKDGYNLTVGTNFIGLYFTVEALRNQIKEGKFKRLVLVSSLVSHFGRSRHYEKYFKKYHRSSFKQYAVSKRMILEYGLYLSSDLYGQTEVTLCHPGLASTNIVGGEATTFSKRFQHAGKRFMHRFGNSADKSSLCLVQAAVKSPANLGYFYPKHFFHIRGIPKEKRLHLSEKKYARLLKSLSHL